MHEHHPKYDIERFNRPPTLSEYSTAKKEMEQSDCGNPKCKDCHPDVQIGVDTGDGESESVVLVVDRDTFLDLYWGSIPDNKKRKIKVGDSHDQTRFPSKRS